ncbi:MAG: HNH endonuclease [Cyanobacteria bacterium P01_G01_bin.67]
MLNCVYCKTAYFEKGKGLREHIILSSIGGRKVSRDIDCENCNNKLGLEIDEPFSKRLGFFSTMLGITTGRNKNAPIHKNFVKHEGENYDLLPGGKFRLSKTSVNFENKNIPEQESVSITAPNAEQALSKLDQALGKWNKSRNDLTELKATHTKSYIPPINGQLPLGGETQFRSVAKMLLTYLATMINPKILRNGQFDRVIEYIHKGNNNYNSCFWDFILPIPSEPKISEINHRIFIFASEEKKLVFGVLELFGYLKFSAVLTDNWSGGDLNKVHVIDPTTGEKEEHEIVAPDRLFDFVDERFLKESFENQCNNSTKKIIKAYQRRQFQQIMSDIAKKTIENNITSKGKIITKAKYNKIIEEFILELNK